MIKLFRNIRKNLLAKGKTTNYLKYAIGEIVLVVIGILIALSINNWNDDRALKKKEEHYLSEIKENLEDDINLIDEIFEYNHKKDSILNLSMNPLLSYNSDRVIGQILAQHYDSNSSFYLFYLKNTAFKNMTESESIGLIQNELLRAKLTNYYQKEDELKVTTQARLASLIREFTDLVTEIILNKETISSILGKNNQWPLDTKIGHKQKTLLLGKLINIQDNLKTQDNILFEIQKNAIELRDLIIQIQK